MPTKDRKITIIISGSDKDAGDVRLSDFIHQLDLLKTALKQSERRVRKEEQSKVFYRITALSHSSPATVTVEAFSEKEKDELPFEAVEMFFDDLDHIRNRGTIPHDADYQTLRAYSDLSSLRGKNINHITIKNGHRIFQLDEKYDAQLKEVMGADEFEYGSVIGRLEVINAHHLKKFVVYPELGVKKLECFFEDDLKNMVKEGLYSRVQVEGELHYKSWDKFPYAIKVKKIETIPDDADLPLFKDLLGIAPDITEGKTIDQFIETLHNEKW